MFYDGRAFMVDGLAYLEHEKDHLMGSVDMHRIFYFIFGRDHGLSMQKGDTSIQDFLFPSFASNVTLLIE